MQCCTFTTRGQTSQAWTEMDVGTVLKISHNDKNCFKMSLKPFTPRVTSLPFQHSDPNSAQAEPTGIHARQMWANRKCSSTMFMWLYVVSRGFWSGTAHAFCTVHGISHKATCWIKESPNGTSGPVAWPWLQQNMESWLHVGDRSKCLCLCMYEILNMKYWQQGNNSCNKMRGTTEMQIQEPLLWKEFYSKLQAEIWHLYWPPL